MSTVRLAILDLYDGTPNQGMRCINELVARFSHKLEWEVFDVRGKAEVPDLSFDIYISTGGPGDPRVGDGVWDEKYYEWLESLWDWNAQPGNPRKYGFFICHSFQMACIHFRLAEVKPRKSMAFGTFPVHMAGEGVHEPLFEGLPNPFFIADFRHYQVIQPKANRLRELGAEILALEKIRAHIPLERAIMGIRFSQELIGVQFHPEADPDGMLKHFLDPERRKAIVEEHGQEKYLRMIDHLHDSDKIALTHEVILPMFLQRSIKSVEATSLIEV